MITRIINLKTHTIMKNFSYLISKKSYNITYFLVIVLLMLTGCKEKPEEEKVVLMEEDPKIQSSEPGMVEVITNNMDFQLPRSIPSGWTTFKYRNQSAETHFFLIEKYPEGKTKSSADEEVLPVFQKAMDLINAGKQEEGMAEFANLPEWFQNVKFLGGAGLIAPGKIAETTVYLEPGNYLLECYVKMNNGVFHSAMGMVAELEVTSDKNKKEPLSATSEITISSNKGIEFNENLEAGRHIFKVNFLDQTTYANFVGHDVHLVKLSPEADLKTLENWMNWLDPKGLISPMPEGFEFMGGVQEMPAGDSAYFTANLEEGHYAFISEIPNASKHNMLKKFTIKKKDLAIK